MKQSPQPMDAVGLYLSIPFCRAKCTFCNFASDAFTPTLLPLYIDRLTREISAARTRTADLGAYLPNLVDTLYLGGGTPSLLSPADVHRLFSALRTHFTLSPDAEITVECAPNQLSPETLEALQLNGVNRLSFGIQSFVDRETAAIGRLHTERQCLDEIDRVRCAGILNLSLDLIAGLPHQTATSWRRSVEQAIATGVPHLSIYMLEVDDESRLGREILSSGSRYGAPHVPTDDDSATFYELACSLLASAGIPQVEISNFARPGFASAHNLKYWRRHPYLGLGLDAHSMLRTAAGAVRFSNTADLDAYLLPQTQGREAPPLTLLSPRPHHLTPEEAFEETLFLGLRLNEGLDLDNLRRDFGQSLIDNLIPTLAEAVCDGLLTVTGSRARLTPRGRVLSNELFSRLLLPTPAGPLTPPPSASGAPSSMHPDHRAGA